MTDGNPSGSGRIGLGKFLSNKLKLKKAPKQPTKPDDNGQSLMNAIMISTVTMEKATSRVPEGQICYDSLPVFDNLSAVMEASSHGERSKHSTTSGCSSSPSRSSIQQSNNGHSGTGISSPTQHPNHSSLSPIASCGTQNSMMSDGSSGLQSRNPSMKQSPEGSIASGPPADIAMVIAGLQLQNIISGSEMVSTDGPPAVVSGPYMSPLLDASPPKSVSNTRHELPEIGELCYSPSKRNRQKSYSLPSSPMPKVIRPRKIAQYCENNQGKNLGSDEVMVIISRPESTTKFEPSNNPFFEPSTNPFFDDISAQSSEISDSNILHTPITSSTNKLGASKSSVTLEQEAESDPSLDTAKRPFEEIYVPMVIPHVATIAELKLRMKKLKYVGSRSDYSLIDESVFTNTNLSTQAFQVAGNVSEQMTEMNTDLEPTEPIISDTPKESSAVQDLKKTLAVTDVLHSQLSLEKKSLASRIGFYRFMPCLNIKLSEDSVDLEKFRDSLEDRREMELLKSIRERLEQEILESANNDRATDSTTVPSPWETTFVSTDNSTTSTKFPIPALTLDQQTSVSKEFRIKEMADKNIQTSLKISQKPSESEYDSETETATATISDHRTLDEKIIDLDNEHKVLKTRIHNILQEREKLLLLKSPKEKPVVVQPPVPVPLPDIPDVEDYPYEVSGKPGKGCHLLATVAVIQNDDRIELSSNGLSTNREHLDVDPNEAIIFQAVRLNDRHTINYELSKGVSLVVRHLGMPCVVKAPVLNHNIRMCGYGLLHVAVCHSSLAVIKQLVDAGCDINSLDSTKRSPFFLSCVVDRRNVSIYLIDSGADVNLTPCSKKTALMHAINNKNGRVASAIISQENCEINAADATGSTALYLASMAAGNDPRFVQMLIDGGADVNKANKMGATPLHIAVQARQHLAVKALVRAGADLNLGDNRGRRAIHSASPGKQYLDLVCMLAWYGADLNAAENSGKRAIDYAIQFGNAMAVKFFIVCDSNFDPKSLNCTFIEKISTIYPEFADWLTTERTQPKSLLCICRQKIRKTIPPKNLCKISSLDIPKVLRNFLTLKYEISEFSKTTFTLRQRYDRPRRLDPQVLAHFEKCLREIRQR